jgi:hypothetical protein
MKPIQRSYVTVFSKSDSAFAGNIAWNVDPGALISGERPPVGNCF